MGVTVLRKKCVCVTRGKWEKPACRGSGSSWLTTACGSAWRERQLYRGEAAAAVWRAPEAQQGASGWHPGQTSWPDMQRSPGRGMWGSGGAHRPCLGERQPVSSAWSETLVSGSPWAQGVPAWILIWKNTLILKWNVLYALYLFLKFLLNLVLKNLPDLLRLT